MPSDGDLGRFDEAKVDAFVGSYLLSSGHVTTLSRIRELDGPIAAGALSLADITEAVKRLAPSGSVTHRSKELRIERLLRAIPPR